MFSNRKITISAAIVVILIVVYTATSYVIGIKAENTLQDQYKMLEKIPFFKVQSHTYKRGWFSSTEVTELTFNRHLSGPYEGLIPDNLTPLLNTKIKFTNYIQHGPLPGWLHGDFRPGQAWVRTEFAMSDNTKQMLAKFFGNQEPIVLVNRLYFNGGGELKVNVPAFNYQEPISGVQVQWKGLDFIVDYAKKFTTYKLDFTMPGLYLQAASRGSVEFDSAHYVSDKRPGQTGVILGNSELTIGGIQLQSKESIPYSVKLNELLYLMTRIRVGDFINPSGELKPSSVSLKGLNYQVVTNEIGEFVNTRGKVKFAEFKYNDDLFGPMRLDVSANHLHGPTLVKLDQSIAAIPFEGVDPDILRQEYLNVIKAQGFPLLENDPKIIVDDFYLKMPSGEAIVKGSVAMTGVTKRDMENAQAFLKRFDIDAEISIPRKTLESLVVTQARNLFQVDQSAEDQPNMAEVENLARSLLDVQLNQWEAEKYLTEQKGQLNTRIEFHKGDLHVNKQKVPISWDGEPLDDESTF